ncbi:hypothetical protein [Natranaeroarchaeum sulfidigenes]|nr:hypothetical protein [Natranaeroarchaeum sulfidigenes]
MPEHTRLERIIIAVALTEFSAQHEQTDPELAEYAERLAEERLDWRTAK